MSVSFNKTQIRPNDPGFQYEVEKDFEVQDDDNDWDSTPSEKSASLSHSEPVVAPATTIIATPQPAKSQDEEDSYDDGDIDDVLEMLDNTENALFATPMRYRLSSHSYGRAELHVQRSSSEQERAEADARDCL